MHVNDESDDEDDDCGSNMTTGEWSRHMYRTWAERRDEERGKWMERRRLYRPELSLDLDDNYSMRHWEWPK